MVRIYCLIIGYICGLFQTSYLIGKSKNIDIREHGSGNAGTTNALRIMGKKAGAMTLIGDCLKSVVAMLLVKNLFAASGADMMALLMLYAGAGVILGHNFPCYLNFKGGKGVAASVGMVICFDMKIFLICAVIFFTIFFLTHYVSLCSLTAYLSAFILMIIQGQKGVYGMSANYLVELYILMACLTALAYYRHRANIVRLIHGTESKVLVKKK